MTRALFLLLLFLSAFTSSVQAEEEGPSLEVLIAAADAGNGRAALMVYDALKETDLGLASYFAHVAFREFAPGACRALLEMLTLRGALQKTKPNTRAGAVALCAVRDRWRMDPNAPMELGAYELPHAAKALAALGFWDGEIPAMGVLPSQEAQARLQQGLKRALNDPRVRSRVQRVIGKIASEMVCDKRQRICTNQRA